MTPLLCEQHQRRTKQSHVGGVIISHVCLARPGSNACRVHGSLVLFFSATATQAFQGGRAAPQPEISSRYGASLIEHNDVETEPIDSNK